MSWNLNQISRLISAKRNPSETLTNIVHEIQRRFDTDVCSVYLLEPDRANLVLAATVGLRPESVGRVRMRLSEGLAGLVAQQQQPAVCRRCDAAPRFKYFSEAGEDSYRSFLGVPLFHPGVLLGVLVVQTIEAREFGQEAIERLCHRRGAARAHRRARRARSGISSHRRISGSRRSRRTCGGAGTTRRPASSASSIRCSGVETITTRSRSCRRFRPTRSRARTSELVLHSRINYAYRRLQEYLQARHTWGGRHAGVLRARPVAYFSAEFGLHESLPIYSGGLGVLAGDHIKSASDLGIPLVGIGLYYDQGYFRQRLDRDGWQQEDYLDRRQPPAADRAGARATACRSMVAIETRTGTIFARVWTVAVGRNTLLLLDSNVDGNQPEDRAADGAALRRRHPRADPPGTAAGRRRRSRARRDGDCARRGPSERGAQRVCGAGAGPPPDGGRGVGVRRGDPATSRADRLHHAHPRAAGHDRFTAPLVEEHLGQLREAMTLCSEDFMGLGRVNPGDASETFCMTVLALKLCRHANAVSSLHGRGVAADVDVALSRAGGGRGADRAHHQRRARPELAGAADAPALRPPPRSRLAGALSMPRDLGSDRGGRRRRALGDAAGPEGAG